MALTMQPTINPYLLIGKQYADGLEAIAADGPTDTSELENSVFDYISGIYYTSITVVQEVELRSIIRNCINSYINSTLSEMYSLEQREFINLMIGSSFINGLTVDTLGVRIRDIEDNITKNNLTVDQQQPLFLATMIGSTAYSYFLAKITTPGDWASYFSGALVSPTANLPFWVAIGMEGSLIGARTTSKGLIETTDEIVSINIISALTAALTITCGKIMFMWVPRIRVNAL